MRSRRATPLSQAATHGDPTERRVPHILYHHGRRTKPDYHGRYTVSGKDTTTSKLDAARAQITHLNTLQRPGTTIAYADGSKLEAKGRAHTGATCVLLHDTAHPKTLKAGLWKRAEVYDAETLALTLALHAAVIARIVLFSDGLATTSTVTDPCPPAGRLLTAYHLHASLRHTSRPMHASASFLAESCSAVPDTDTSARTMLLGARKER